MPNSNPCSCHWQRAGGQPRQRTCLESAVVGKWLEISSEHARKCRNAGSTTRTRCVPQAEIGRDCNQPSQLTAILCRHASPCMPHASTRGLHLVRVSTGSHNLKETPFLRDADNGCLFVRSPKSPRATRTDRQTSGNDIYFLSVLSSTLGEQSSNE